MILNVLLILPNFKAIHRFIYQFFMQVWLAIEFISIKTAHITVFLLYLRDHLILIPPVVNVGIRRDPLREIPLFNGHTTATATLSVMIADIFKRLPRDDRQLHHVVVL